MLTIRREQWDLFAKADVERFEDWVHDHVRKFFPAQYRTAGESRIRELIRNGRERAAAHGFMRKRDVCQYIDLMVVLGRDFDSDPALPWAASILQKPRDPVAKMQNLYKLAMDHVNARKR